LLLGQGTKQQAPPLPGGSKGKQQNVMPL